MSLISILEAMLKVLEKYWVRIVLHGLSMTLLLAIVTVIGGTILGTIVAIGRMSKSKILRAIITAYVEVVRGTPALVQLYVGYLFLPNLFPSLNLMDPQAMAFICVAVALILNSGAYVSEIIRSGIQAVDKGQTEASRSLGISSVTTMTDIVLPQAVKNILPALGNEFITVIKETSLASTFFVGDLMSQYKEIVGQDFNAFPTLLVIAVIYFVLTFILSKVVGFFERRMKHDS